MVIELKFSCLESASKFEAKHKSYRFHRDLEGLLFTEEMKLEANNVNVQLKLSVTFDAAEMGAIKRFFLKRDGGETPNVYLTSSDEELDDQYSEEDMKTNSDGIIAKPSCFFDQATDSHNDTRLQSVEERHRTGDGGETPNVYLTSSDEELHDQYSEEDMKTNSDGINAKPATDSHKDTRLQSVEERHCTGREVNIAQAIGDLERTKITGPGPSEESERTSRSTLEHASH
ncbi:uncharacterized protein [Ptychodera flava]|uniref:uncharacterized protein n=1 Tax=Ptychodera flava TaxID=63121 RepID=UPI003969F78E